MREVSNISHYFLSSLYISFYILIYYLDCNSKVLIIKTGFTLYKRKSRKQQQRYHGDSVTIPHLWKKNCNK